MILEIIICLVMILVKFVIYYNKIKKTDQIKIKHISDMRKLNSIVGPESLYKEYKEFTIELNNYFGESEICKLLQNDSISDDFKQKFNKCCLNNILKYYVSKYLRKYIVSMQGGTLHLGIADMPSLLTGIPYFGEIPTHNIIENVKNCFEKNIRVKDVDEQTNKKVLKWIIENLVITFEKLIIDKSYIDDQYINRLHKLMTTCAKSELIWKKYDEKIKKWLSIFNKYTQRLRKIINDFNIRKEILKFIQIKAQYKKLELEEYKQARDFYESKIIIDYEITYDILRKDLKLPSDICTNPMEFEHDYNNYLSWLVIFKDFTINKLKKKKPKHPDEHIKNFSYLEFAKYMSNIQYSLMIQKCNFFVIIFQIPYHPSNYELEYNNINIENTCNNKKYNKTKQIIWFSAKREITKEGPTTVKL